MFDKNIISSDIIFPKIKNNIFNIVKNKALYNNGIIFGGMVRDTIISEHYKNLFNHFVLKEKKKKINKKFWDITYHPETALRTLVSNDIDVCFKSIYESENFIYDLIKICEDEKIEFKKIDVKAPMKYGENIIVNKYIMTINVGKIPFTFAGYKLDIIIDIVIPNDINLLPPFKNLDMLCNGFLMTKQGIILSKHTGTYLDKLSEFERTKEAVEIMNDMIQLKTLFCWKGVKTCTKGLSYNAHAYKRINKLVNNSFPSWSITNLPFKIEQATKENTHQQCCICFSNFEKKESMSVVSSNNIECSKMHTKCFFEYMNHQINDAYNNILGDYCNKNFAFKCPMRTPIDFSKCK